MSRGKMHGETPQAYADRRAYEVERLDATRQYEEARDAGRLSVVELERPCTCRAYPFAHFHMPEGKARVRG